MTTENNFEVVLRRVIGNNELPEEIRPDYYRRLGIDPPKPDGEFFQNPFEFVEYTKMDAAAQDEFNESYEAALGAPWKAADHPRLAKWLEAEDDRLDRLAEGSKRPHYYTPYVVSPENEGASRIIAVLLPSVQYTREFARAFSMRAMLRLGNGDVKGAWNDAQAMHRIARHVDDGGTLVEKLVGIAIDAMAHQVDVAVLHSPDTSPEHLKAFLADLAKLPPLDPMADTFDETERYVGLDATQSFARHGLEEFKKFGAFSGVGGSTLGTLASALLRGAANNGAAPLSVDWNVTMELLNEQYDDLAAMARIENREKRAEKFDELDEKLKELATEARNPWALALKLAGGDPRKTTGKVIGNVLVSLLLPAVRQAVTAEDVATARLDVTRLAFALRVHHAETGAFPKSLDALVPKYASKVPTDAITGKPLRYERSKDGFLLYSVGRNGRDDGGRGYDDRPEHDRESDDIAIRFPAG